MRMWKQVLSKLKQTQITASCELKQPKWSLSKARDFENVHFDMDLRQIFNCYR